MDSKVSSFAAALVLAVLGGIVGGYLASTLPAAAFTLGGAYPYSFAPSGGYYCVTPNEVDPVSIVFTTNAVTEYVHVHAHHHGSWTNHSGTTQWFLRSSCSNQVGQDASSCGVCSRYHMRYSPFSVDPGWGTNTLATPHYEDITSCGHAVESNWDEPPGGFVKAKWNVGDNWGAGYAHPWQGYEFWDNMDAMWQCDGWPAWNDGYVDFFPVGGA